MTEITIEHSTLHIIYFSILLRCVYQQIEVMTWNLPYFSLVALWWCALCYSSGLSSAFIASSLMEFFHITVFLKMKKFFSLPAFSLFQI